VWVKGPRRCWSEGGCRSCDDDEDGGDDDEDGGDDDGKLVKGIMP